MRNIYSVIILIFCTNACAEFTFTIVDFTDNSTALYDFSVERETGDPLWTIAKIEHQGGRPGVWEHGP